MIASHQASYTISLWGRYQLGVTSLSHLQTTYHFFSHISINPDFPCGQQKCTHRTAALMLSLPPEPPGNVVNLTRSTATLAVTYQTTRHGKKKYQCYYFYTDKVMQREVNDTLSRTGNPTTDLNQVLYPFFFCVVPGMGWPPLRTTSSPETGSVVVGAHSKLALSQRKGRQGNN